MKIISFRVRNENSLSRKVLKHIKAHKGTYLALGLTAAFTFGIIDPAFAGIDEGGEKIHSKIASVGKWVIVSVGTVDTIQAVLERDFQRAKSHFIGYVLCFAIILAYPWALSEVEGVFKDA